MLLFLIGQEKRELYIWNINNRVQPSGLFLTKTMTMKHQLLYLFIPLALLVVSCQPTNQLEVSKAEVCLNMYGKSTCLKDKDQLLRLHLVDDSVRLERVSPDLRVDFRNFPQYGKPRKVPAASYDVSVKGGLIYLKDSLANFEVNGELGFLIWNGQGNSHVMISTPVDEDCGKWSLVMENGSIMRKLQNMGSSMTATSRMVDVDGDGTAMIEKVVTTATALRTIPGDTGTEIVILDDFTPKLNDCCEEGYEVCCEDNDRGGVSNNDPIEPSPELLEMGLVIPIEDCCLWEDCHRIVVVDCRTGEIRCYDTLECSVTITLSGPFVVISTSDGCDSSPGLTVCSG